jgi:hypothetical protein
MLIIINLALLLAPHPTPLPARKPKLFLLWIIPTNNGIVVHAWDQGCQMVYFQTKSHNLDTFWSALEWERLYLIDFYIYVLCSTDIFKNTLLSVALLAIKFPFPQLRTESHMFESFMRFYQYSLGIWNILRPYISWPFANLVAIWYIFPRFGILCQEKSGNPACGRCTTYTQGVSQ